MQANTKSLNTKVVTVSRSYIEGYNAGKNLAKNVFDFGHYLKYYLNNDYRDGFTSSLNRFF